MKPVRLHPAAEAELEAAADRYEAESPRLRERFLRAFAEASRRVSLRPRAHGRWEGEVRLSLLRSFPFGIYFPDQPEGIWIVAVAHHSRRPGYWSDRLSDE